MHRRLQQLRTWLAWWSQFTGYPYRLFDGAIGTICLSFCWYIKTAPSVSTDNVLSGVGLAVLGAHTWGWLLFGTGWAALVASMFTQQARSLGYAALFGVTAAWSLWLAVGAVVIRLLGDSEAEMMWKALGSGVVWGMVATHLLYQVLRQREDAQQAGDA